MKTIQSILRSTIVYTVIITANIGILHAELIDVPITGQQKANWCWAGSCDAIIKTYNVQGVSQTDIVTYIKGGPLDVGGNEHEMTDALNHFGSCNAGSVGVFGEDVLKQHGDNYHPLVIGWTYTGGSGHAVVYAGYNGKKDRVVHKIMNPSPMGSGSWNFLNFQTIQNAQGKGSWTVSVTTSKEVTILMLTSCNDGGDFTQGDALTVSWLADFQGTVKLELMKAGAKVQDLATVDVGASPYTWTIPDDLDDGREYKIRVVKSDETNIQDISDMNFTVCTPPRFTSDSVAQATYQTDFSFTVTAEDNGNPSDLTLNIYQFLPNGITFTDNKDGTGTLAGKPAINGTFTFEIQLRDKTIITPIMQNFKLTIEGINKPVITKQPQPVSVLENDTAVFEITVEGVSVEYKWKENGLDIPGETDSILVLPAVTLDDNGKLYQCVVTNPAGIVRSETVTLTVTKISEISFIPITVKETFIEFAVCPNPVPGDTREVVFVVNVPPITHGTLTIFDATGSLVDRLGVLQKGNYIWDLRNRQGRNVSTGTYLALLTVTGRDGTKNEYRTYVGVER